MSGKVCKYVDQKIINNQNGSAEDRFRQEIGSYFEADDTNTLAFRDYTENSDRRISVDFREEISIIRPPTPVSAAAEEIGYQTSPALSLGLTSPPDPTAPVAAVSAETGDVVEVREIEIETLPSRTQTIVVKPKQQTLRPSDDQIITLDSFSSESEFVEYVNSIFDVEKEFFEDNYFTTTKPLSQEEAKILGTNSTVSENAIDVTYNYNFYDEFYERITLNPRLPETGIKNLYSFTNDRVRPDATDGGYADISKAVTLTEGINPIENLRRSDLEIPRSQRSAFTNLYVPYDTASEFSENSYLSTFWPMGVNFKITLDRTARLPQVLKTSELADLLLRQAGDSPFPEAVSNPVFGAEEQSYQSDGSLAKEITSRPIKEINVLAWFEDALLRNASGLASTYDYFGPETEGSDIGDGEPAARVLFGGSPALGQYEGLILFIIQLENLAETYRRSFEDVLTGKEPRSEIVAYKISKFDASRPGSDAIQNYYIYNTNGQFDIMEFVDSQVKYGKKYQYVVHAYHAVFGTAYSYENIRFLTQEQGFIETEAQIDVVTRPTLRMYEIPVYESVGQILDHPPVPPSIDVIPFFGVGDKIRFNMNGGTGLLTQDPVALLQSDEQFYSDYRQTYRLNPEDPITFKNDDTVSAFQIFRIEKKPLSYSDFKDQLRATVSTDIDPRSPMGASSASLIEDVAPNRKYYYTFRAIDVHGLPSPPSIVYEIEIIDDGATIFPIIRAYDMPTKQEQEDMSKMPTRSFNRLFYLAPKFSHSYLNEDKSGLTGARTAIGSGPDIYLGNEAEPVWGKKFKVRLVSKSTGKKIDFNFIVDHKHIQTEKERN